MKNLPNELAPCGVYCGACPSFNRSCFGCTSELKKGTRSKSRARCKVRDCCFNTMNLNYCAECEQFPCSNVNMKLIMSHPGDPKYKYRHELPQIVMEFRKLGAYKFLIQQKKRWECPHCGGIVHFYHYKCSKCSKLVDV